MSGLDESKGGTFTNSDADADTADEYFDNTYGANEWANIDADDKGRPLITATAMLGELTVRYGKAASFQALNFPVDSESAEDEYGNALGDGYTEATKACSLFNRRCVDHGCSPQVP